MNACGKSGKPASMSRKWSQDETVALVGPFAPAVGFATLITPTPSIFCGNAVPEFCMFFNGMLLQVT
jgi:hypothetical protein